MLLPVLVIKRLVLSSRNERGSSELANFPELHWDFVPWTWLCTLTVGRGLPAAAGLSWAKNPSAEKIQDLVEEHKPGEARHMTVCQDLAELVEDNHYFEFLAEGLWLL